MSHKDVLKATPGIAAAWLFDEANGAVSISGNGDGTFGLGTTWDMSVQPSFVSAPGLATGSNAGRVGNPSPRFFDTAIDNPGFFLTNGLLGLSWSIEMMFKFDAAGQNNNLWATNSNTGSVATSYTLSSFIVAGSPSVLHVFFQDGNGNRIGAVLTANVINDANTHHYTWRFLGLGGGITQVSVWEDGIKIMDLPTTGVYFPFANPVTLDLGQNVVGIIDDSALFSLGLPDATIVDHAASALLSTSSIGSFGLEDSIPYPHSFRSSFGSTGIEDAGFYNHKFRASLASIGIEVGLSSFVDFVTPIAGTLIAKGTIVPVTVTVNDPDTSPAIITTEIYWSPTGLLADIVLIGSTPAGGPHTLSWDTTTFASGQPGALFARAIDDIGPGGYSSIAIALDAVPDAPVITSPTTGQIFGPLDIIPITWTASTDPDNLPATLKYSVQFSIDSGTNFNDVPGLTFDGGAGVGLTAFGAITISTLALPINNVIVRVAAWDGFFMSAYASVSFRIPVVLDQSSISFVDPVTDVIIELLAWEWTDPIYEGWSSQPRARFFDGNLTRITQIRKADPKRQHLTGSGTFMPDTVAKRIIAIMSGTDITQQWHRLKIVWVDLWGNQWTIRIVKMLPTWQPGLMEYHWEFDFVVIAPPAVFKTGCDE